VTILIVDRQPGMRVVGARWVYIGKIDGNAGKPTSYKARWVADSKESTSMSSMLLSLTRIQSGCSSPLSTIWISSATKLMSNRHSSTAILRR
jgi:hypothetical protein